MENKITKIEEKEYRKLSNAITGINFGSYVPLHEYDSCFGHYELVFVWGANEVAKKFIKDSEKEILYKIILNIQQSKNLPLLKRSEAESLDLKEYLESLFKSNPDVIVGKL